jgi:hypothetical protein
VVQFVSGGFVTGDDNQAESELKRYAIFLLFLLLPGLLAFSPPQQSNEIILRVDSGIGGWYRAGQWVPLLITVESENRTVDGQLQVRVSSSSTTSATQFETTYRAPFTIAAGDSKRVFLYVSLNDFAREVQVELLDNESGVVTIQREDVQQLAYDDILHAVVTESTTGILDVSRHTIGRGQNIQTSWQLDEIPPNADALRSLDVLYFTDVDTGQLTTDQINAITDWVASGGHLVVTGGPNWQRTTNGLTNLLPVTPQETVTLDDLTALAVIPKTSKPVRWWLTAPRMKMRAFCWKQTTFPCWCAVCWAAERSILWPLMILWSRCAPGMTSATCGTN